MLLLSTLRDNLLLDGKNFYFLADIAESSQVWPVRIEQA